MATLLYEPVFTLVTKWFSARRKAALTTVTVVGATASLIFSPLTERLHASLGWRDALLVLAAVLGAVAVPLHALVLRPAPGTVTAAAREQARLPPRLLGSPPFWLLAGAFTLASFSTYAIVVHLVSLLIHGSRDASFAALVAGLLGVSQLPRRLVFRLVGRRLGEAALPVAVFGWMPQRLGACD